MRQVVSFAFALLLCAGTARAQTPATSASAPAAAPSGAAAQPATTVGASFTAPQLTGPSVWAVLPWGGYGLGARLMLPLGIPGIIQSSSVRDTFALEVGADLLHWSYDYGVPGFSFDYSWTEILAVGDFMWNLWFSNRFALYPKLGLGYAFGWLSGYSAPGPQPTFGGFFVSGDAGAMYKMTGGLTLRVEVGSDGLKAGAGWLF